MQRVDLAKGWYLIRARQLVDIAAYTSAFAMRHDLDWPKLPLLNAWFTRINARPGVVRGRGAS